MAATSDFRSEAPYTACWDQRRLICSSAARGLRPRVCSSARPYAPSGCYLAAATRYGIGWLDPLNIYWQLLEVADKDKTLGRAVQKQGIMAG
jgi:hypothetical protein